MLYARNNKYLRATIILWNLKGWLEIPRRDAPKQQRTPQLLLKVTADFPTRLPRLGTASCLRSDSLYFVP